MNRCCPFDEKAIQWITEVVETARHELAGIQPASEAENIEEMDIDTYE